MAAAAPPQGFTPGLVGTLCGRPVEQRITNYIR